MEAHVHQRHLKQAAATWRLFIDREDAMFHSVYLSVSLLLDKIRERRQEETFTCPRCGLTSYNPNDAKNRYCGNCHTFFVDLNSGHG